MRLAKQGRKPDAKGHVLRESAYVTLWERPNYGHVPQLGGCRRPGGESAAEGSRGGGGLLGPPVGLLRDAVAVDT